MQYRLMENNMCKFGRQLCSPLYHQCRVRVWMNFFFKFFSRIKVVKRKEFKAEVKPNQFFFFKMISNKTFWRMKYLQHHQICISTLNAYILFRNRAKMPFFILLWHPMQIEAWMNFSLHTKWKVDPSNLPFIFTQRQTHTHSGKTVLLWLEIFLYKTWFDFPNMLSISYI